MTSTEILAEPGVPQIVVLREFDTSPTVLFRAHTEPDLLRSAAQPGVVGGAEAWPRVGAGRIGV